MTKGNPGRVLLRFALPILLGNLFNLAYNLADTRIVGQFLGEAGLAKVGSVSTLSDVLTSFLVGLANGFAVLTARTFGAGGRERVRRCFSASLLLGFCAAILLSAVFLFSLSPLLRVLNVPQDAMDGARAYLSVLLSGLCFQALYNVQAANLRAVGDAYTPLLFLIGSALLNTALDALFVGPLGLGVAGAAAATVLSQAIAAGGIFLYTRKKYPFLHKAGERKIPGDLIPPLLSGGLSMALMSTLVAFGTLSLQAAINTLGEDIIVAHSATRKLTSLLMLPFAVLGTTMATYCGQNYGAGQLPRIRQGLRRALLLGSLWSALCILAAYTICPVLIRMITASGLPEIVEPACRYQRIDTLFYLLPAAISILRNSLQGMGDHVTPVVSSGLELIGKVAIALTLAPLLGYLGIIWAEPIVWAVMVVPLLYSSARKLRRAAAP